MSTIKSIKDLVVLVTGGSSGLGLGCVQHFLDGGATVVNFDLNPAKDDTVNRHDNYTYFKGNVSCVQDAAAVMKEVKEKHGRLDVLVSNAGIVPQVAPLWDNTTNTPVDLDIFRKTYEVNVIGAINMISHCVGVMSRNEPNDDGLRGVIVMTGSADPMGNVHYEGLLHYLGSKAAINGMTGSLATELRHHGIRAVTISPGAFMTSILRDVDVETISPIVKRWRANILPGRLGDPREFGHCVQLAVENTMFNGVNLCLDGMSKLSLDHRTV